MQRTSQGFGFTQLACVFDSVDVTQHQPHCSKEAVCEKEYIKRDAAKIFR